MNTSNLSTAGRIILLLPADVAIEIRTRPLENGRRSVETLMNDGTYRRNVSWRENGVTKFESHEEKLCDSACWKYPDAEYASIQKRNPRDGEWVVLRAE